MASSTQQRIFNLPPGGFLRSSSGFFYRLPTGSIAFIPSIFRLPWHPESARIVGSRDIAKLLRAETIELVTSVSLLIVGIHYFYSDILGFYMTVLSLPLAIVAHGCTTLIGVFVILAVNNFSISWFRIKMVANLPVAPGGGAADALRRWSATRRVWPLSFLDSNRAAYLNKFAVLLYLLMFWCSGPMLVVVLIMLTTSGKAQSLDGTTGVVFALYIAISVWASIESSLVLHRRMRAGRQRREAKQAAAQGS